MQMSLAMANTTNNYTRCEMQNCTRNQTQSSFESSVCITLQFILSRNNTAPVISKIILIVINVSSSIFATVTNLLVLTVLTKKQELRTGANLILTSMAISDLLVGAIVQPLQNVYTLYDIFEKDWCPIKNIASYLGSLCVVASLMNICFFAIDRCFAVMLPYLYLEHIIYKKYLIVLITGWVCITLLVMSTVLHLIGNSVLLDLFTVLFVFALFLICVCYVVVFYFIRVQRNKIMTSAPLRRNRYIIEDFGKNIETEQQLRNNEIKILSKRKEDLPPEPKAMTILSVINCRRKYNLEQIEMTEYKKAGKDTERELKRQAATSRTVLVIVGVFMLCYLPITVLKLLRKVIDTTDLYLHLVDRWGNVPIVLNSSLNPIIYCIRVKSIRQEIRKLIKKFSF